MYLQKKFTDYKKYAAAEARKQYKECTTNMSVKAIAVFRFGTKRKKDLPNAGKLEYDAFNGIIYEDDTQITEIETKKIYDKENPGVTFEFYIAEPSVWGGA
jgi:Holliday junction resolvase RusA-like endonuclease